MSVIIDRPPEFTWKEYSIDFGTAKVPLWCPQTPDFNDHEKGNWKRKGGIDKDEIEDFEAFRQWKERMRENIEWQGWKEGHPHHNRPYSLKSIHIRAVTRLPNGPVGFVKMDAWIQRDPTSEEEAEAKDPQEFPVDYTNTLYESVFLRGGSVAILMILRPSDKRDEPWVILTEQARTPACSWRFAEIPAGIISDSNFKSHAARKIEEETGLKINESDLIDMTELALKDSDDDTETLAKAMFPSPGGCDEYVRLLLWEKEMDRMQIDAMRGKINGLATAGETITLRIEKLTDLWRVGARDAKALGAWALYQGLSDKRMLAQEEEQRNIQGKQMGTSGMPLSGFLASLKRGIS